MGSGSVLNYNSVQVSAVRELDLFKNLKKLCCQFGWISFVQQSLDDFLLARNARVADTNMAFDHLDFCFGSIHQAKRTPAYAFWR